MKKYYLVILSAFLLMLSGCATVTRDIQVDAELIPNVKLSNYKTYDWLSSRGILKDPNKTWQPPRFDIAGDIKFLIDRELRKREIYGTKDKPDLAVSFFIGIDMEHQVLKLDPDTKLEFNKKIPKGALIVALIDVSSGEVVWLGEAVADVQENVTDEVMRERLDYAVREMFKLLP